MPSQISLADFNRIASGTYNAGQVDIATAKDGSRSLVKVNNHVWHTSKNDVQLAPERVLDVKESFIAALERAGVSAENVATIRKELGVPADLDATAADADMAALVKERFTPLSRQQVRTILDQYANGGRGFTRQSRADVSDKEFAAATKTALAAVADAKTIARRDAANAAAPISGGSAEQQGLQDALSFVFGAKLEDIGAAGRSPRELQDAIVSLFTQALQLLPGGARESTFTLLGTSAKIAKGADGKISATLGRGALATTVELGAPADFADALFNRALADFKTLGAATIKDLLTKASRSDAANQIHPDSPLSLARRFAAKTLAGYAPRAAARAPAFSADDLVAGSTYDTETLDQLARRALDGESAEVLDTMAVASFLSGGKSLADANAARGHSPELPNAFKELFSQARNLSLGHADQSETFTFCGQQAKLVRGEDGMLSVVLRKGLNQTTAKLGVNAQAFVERLLDCAVKDDGTLGQPAVKDILLPLLNGPEPAAGDRTSQMRKAAAAVLAEYAAREAPGTPAPKADDLMSGKYETKFLVQLAQKVLDGGEGSGKALDTLRAASFFSGDESLKVLDTPHRRPNELQDGFKDLFKKAFQLLPGGADQSGAFTFCGMSARIVKGADGNLSVALGPDASALKVPLGIDAKTLVDGLIDCAINEAETLGAAAVKDLLEMVSKREYLSDLVPDQRKSLPRQFAAEILAHSASRAASGVPAFTADELSSKNLDTKVLVHLAGRALDGAATEALETLDTISYFTGEKTLKEVDALRRQRVTDDDALRDQRGESTDKLRNGFKELFMRTLQLLPAGVDHSDDFIFCGTPARIVKVGDQLSIVLGKDAATTTVGLHRSVKEFAEELIHRALVDEAETLGTDTVKGLLTIVLNRDIANRIPHDDRDSLSRRLAADILAGYAKEPAGFTAAQLVSGDFQTMVLAHMAQKALDGEDVEKFNTLDALSRYHEELKQDSAGLSKEMKDLLEPVKDIPLRFDTSAKPSFMFTVSAEDKAVPVAATDKVAIAQAAGKLKLSDIGGVKGIKDFIADLIFSDETIVADVTQRLPGETMRSILSDEKKLFALAQIIANRGVIDAAVSPKIAAVVKKGFDQLIGVLDDAFKKANGDKSLADAAKEDNFVERFAAFFMNEAQLPREVLTQFDAILQAMSTEGCEKLQAHVNATFNVVANEAGVVASDPYRGKSTKAIVAELKGKTLNQILDAAATSDAPGQIGLFKQVISTYFTQLRPADKRSAFAASLRYAETFESGETEKAGNAFTGAVFKGGGPILQKLMQGLPKEMMGPYASVLDDMRAHLAPIPRKVVQAYLMEMISDSTAQHDADPSKPKITSIEVTQSLGAASVGEAFLCKFHYVDSAGAKRSANCVVKIMRHDAEERVVEEGKIFKDAAKKIPGMEKTWEGQFQQYLTEFDFRTEARNVQTGLGLYDVKGGRVPALLNDPALSKEDREKVSCPNVTSMKMSSLVDPKKNVMVAEYVNARGTVDAFFKGAIASVRKVASPVFETDAATGRVVWQDVIDPATKKPRKLPKLLPGVTSTSIASLNSKFYSQYESLREASAYIQQATKVWFYQALIGNGQFHGDAHAGNLMLRPVDGYVSFIDFGNLYKLEDRRPNGPNEKTELTRIILGAAFRKPDFILDGFKQLMSPEGKAVLNAPGVEDKATEILKAVLEKGSFSSNIVYRLQAAVVELQKLGLELPPPINCFILSLARLSNTVTEINTIMNQCRVLQEVADGIPPSTDARDRLDLVGRAFDLFAEAANRPATSAEEKDGQIRAAVSVLEAGMYGVDGQKAKIDMFMPGGAFYEAVLSRLNGASDKPGEVQRLFDILNQHRSDGDYYHDFFGELDQHKRTFDATWNGASPEKQKEAIEAFTKGYATAMQQIAGKFAGDIVRTRLTTVVETKTIEDDKGNPKDITVTSQRVFHMAPPDPFAKALMDLIDVYLIDICAPFNEVDPEFTTKIEDDLLAELKLSKGSLAASGAVDVAVGTVKKGAEKVQKGFEEVVSHIGGFIGGLFGMKQEEPPPEKVPSPKEDAGIVAASMAEAEARAEATVRDAIKKDVESWTGDTGYKVELGI